MSVIHESAENYLESILMLSKQLPVVRSIDVANELGFKKSSVSIAMKNLRESNHITVTKEGYIYLTESGKEIAEMIETVLSNVENPAVIQSVKESVNKTMEKYPLFAY